MSGTSGTHCPPQRRMFAGTGTTDANGNVTINFPASRFTTTPVVTIAVGPTTNASLVDSRITALSAAAVTINVQQALAVTVLAVQLLATKTPANGVLVHVLAVESG